MEGRQEMLEEVPAFDEKDPRRFKPRARDYTDEIRERAEAQGGTFQTNAEVQRIDVVNRAAKGVILADGTRIVAKNILASVAPGQLYGRLLKGHLPDEEKAAQGYRQGRYL